MIFPDCLLQDCSVGSISSGHQGSYALIMLKPY
jgi:hypothetical protein